MKTPLKKNSKPTKNTATVSVSRKRFGIDTLAADEEVLKLNKAISNGEYSIDVAGLVNEIKILHSSRQMRNIKPKEVLRSAQKALITGVMEDSAFRSRLIEIQVLCLEKQMGLEYHIENLKEYVTVKYQKKLKSNYSTVGDRNAVLSNITEKAEKLAAEISKVTELANLVIGDIDQSGWSVQRTTNVLQLSVARERNL